MGPFWDHFAVRWALKALPASTSSGTQVTSTTYNSYGAQSTSGSLVPSIGYAGSYTVPDSGGLDNMRERDYSSATGSFTAVDPLLTSTGQPYAYANDGPTYATDPDGLCSWYNVICGIQHHWRGAAQVAGYVVGGVAIGVCTAATDGICGLAVTIGGLDLPIGAVGVASAIGGAEGALDYSVSAECHTWSGLGQEIGKHALIGGGEGIADEFVPLFEPSDGEHVVPTNWWQTLSQFNPLP